VGANAHTSKRLKHKLMNRFRKRGQAAARPIYGYIVPEDAKSYFDWKKDDSATEKIRKGADVLRASRNCTMTAEWLNENGVPTGPYCRKKKQWDGQLVRLYYRNMLLAGMPGRGFKVSIKNYETGRRVAVKNTKGRPVFIECPHLAHFTVEELESLNALPDAKNAKMGRKPVNGADPRFRVSRKRTRCPGNHARCWYCGREYFWGGNGIVGNLTCSGARERKCWNSIGFNGELAARRMVAAIVAQFGYLDGLDGQFRGIIEAADTELFTGEDSWRDIQAEEDRIARERENVQASLRELGPLPLVREMIDQLTARERSLQQRKHELERLQARELDLPQSAGDLRQLLQQHFEDLAVRSFEFADFMRLLVPEFHVYLVRLCDGGHLLPRAKVRLNLAGCIEDAVHVPALGELLTRELTIDLFKKPPQREEIRERAIQMIDDDFDQREIASKLGGRIKQANVSKAKRLNDWMIAKGLSTPYVLVTEPPDDYPKLRRHKHAKYCFEPLEGYNRPTL
jgi:site-specific DNA recombinase